MVICERCDQENPDGFRFCGNCGAPLADAGRSDSREERKVVTVLFADLVGFTARSEQLDPEDVRATLSPYYARLREELERRGGTVEKFIGDAVMAVFGAPVAHEDDPERAVRAALAIRDAIVEDGKLQVRIAVTTGEALVALGARPAEGEGMVAGDVVNTAARLQSAAPVNGILVGEQTYQATRDEIQYREAEPVEAKGKTERVPVWEAVEARARFGVDTLQTGAPLVGRSRELDLLSDALARARQESSPQLVTLVGVPGIGKSRLVHELAQIVDADEDLITWRQGRSLPYGDGVTYWALAEMVKAHSGILETDPGAETERKLRATVGALLPDEAEAGWVVAQLRPLLGLGAELELGGDRRAESFAAWRRFFEAVAERPTVLVFEDLHWADGSLLDFVDHLVEWAGAVPMLVVGTARPELLEKRPGWGGGKPNALTISLSPLSDEETARLIAALLERAVLPAEAQAALLDRAGGNPLYAEQFVRLVREGWDAEALPLPETVQGIIAARVDGLPHAEKSLLQDVAVLGKVFWLGAACSIAGDERSAVEERLHALVRKEFVRRERRSSVGGETEYAFRHLLVQDVAYGQIPRRERAERHERAAAWIETLGRPEDQAEMLAHHYVNALELRRAAGEHTGELEAHARYALRDAGERALSLSAFPAATRFYRAALDLWPPDDPERPALLLRYCRTRIDDFNLEDELVEEAYDGLLRAGDRRRAAEAKTLLGILWWHRGHNERGVAALQDALALVEDEGPSEEKAFVHSTLSRFAMLAADNEESIRRGEDALRMAEELGLDDLQASTLNNIGVARIELGQVERGFADLDSATEIAARINSPEQCRAVANRAWMAMVEGDLRQAWDLQEQALAIAERFGLEAFVMWEWAELATHAYWRGDWEESTQAYESYRAAVKGASHYMDSLARDVVALIALARGDAERALAESERAVSLSRAASDPQQLDPTLAIRARVLAELGRAAEASELLRELVAAWRERRSIGSTFPAVQAARAACAVGLEREVGESFAGLRRVRPWIVAAQRICAGDPAAAAEVLAEIGSAPDEADARLEAARLLVAEGRRAEADVQLERALAFYSSVGATAYVRAAEALLAASA